VEDLINPDHAPKLRNPLMGPIKWNLEMPSVQFRIHHGEDDADDIVFSDAKASKFQFLCQEGGTVAVDFRIQVSEPDEEEVTKLLFMLNKSVNVSLTNGVEAPDESEDAAVDTSAGPNLLSDLPTFPAEGAGPKSGTEQADDYDALYSKAVAFVKDLNKASISMAKRELKVAPLVAARLLTQMEEEGIVGPPADNGLRDVRGIAA
jgi:DNA segregation ATPase FtsK/SpoIIIE-like protein